MAKGLVVATARGTELREYSGLPTGANVACEVCAQVWEIVFKVSQYGFILASEVSYNFATREVKLQFCNGCYTTMDVLLESGVDATGAVRNILANLVFPTLMQDGFAVK